jgi:hypothetical protein
MSVGLPYVVREAVVAVCGKAFWFKDPLRSFLVSCGVPTELFDRFSEESKFKIARHILSELDTKGDEGFMVQRRIVTELCKLRNLPDEGVEDKDAGLQALRWLKQVAIEQRIEVEEERSRAESQMAAAQRKQAALLARSQKIQELRAVFLSLATATEDPQARGYGFEDFLADLFEAHEIQYRRPYRTTTEQIDGAFKFGGFDYLVEAKWTGNRPPESTIGEFKAKIERMIQSTRGLFVSMIGFRPEVVIAVTQGGPSRIVLMDGEDLSLILEGHISLEDALDLKTRKAAQEGIIYFPLRERFRRE